MDFFGLFKNRKKGSGSAAKERLQFVLVHDRAGVSPELLDRLKEELMQVISKYIEIDQNEFDVQVTRTKSEDGERIVPALVANIPISKMKDPSQETSSKEEKPQDDKKEDTKEEDAKTEDDKKDE